MSISKNQVMELLLQAAPAFEPVWRDHLKFWGDDERGVFNDASEFAGYIVESFGAGKTSEFEAVFATIEKVIHEGDAEARAVAIVGVLEDIQTIATHHAFGSAAFVGWLGPTSRRAWAEIEQLWKASGGSLAEIVRHEKHLDSSAKRRS